MSRRMRPALMQLVILATAASMFSRAAAQEPELLFRVTFDDLTANAQVAKGSPKSTLARDLGLTAKEGFNKRTALLSSMESLFTVNGSGSARSSPMDMARHAESGYAN